MPKRKFKSKSRNQGHNQYHRSGVRQNYGEPVKENERFERYYNQLGILSEDEKADFWATMRRELPNSFRFAGSKGHALAVKQLLIDRYIPEITSVTYNNENVTPPTPISWYPEELAWEMTTPKAIVRKFPPFASFQKFLVSETSVGNISRQEVVSMIPPLLMDIQPHMTVLDLCAAPGSKAAQLIELIHAGEEARVRQVVRGIATDHGPEVSPDGVAVDVEMKGVQPEGNKDSKSGTLPGSTDDGRATGLLIANDVDYKRAQMLVHQMKRLNSPNLIVTNHDASLFPSIRVATEEGKPLRYLKFDRILADVPCSGDGTCRKNVGIWRDWTPGNALGLHILQVRVLIRSLQLLKVGGRMVYSTCSMHPVEDEAVIATAIDRCGGPSKVRIVDCNTALPGLKRRPGLTQWNVMDRSGNIWDSWAQVEKAKEEGQNNDLEKLSETMFPPAESSQAEKIPLERCMRILSHQQDTGGFFIVVLEKLADIRARPESESKKAKPEDSSENANSTVLETMNEATTDIPSKSVTSVANGDTDGATDKSLSGHTLSNPRKHGLQNGDVADGVPAKLQMTEQDMSDRRESATLLNKGTSTVQKSDPSISTSPVQASTRPAEQPFQPKKRENHPFEEPFKYLPASHAELVNISSFYSLSPRFPRDRFMVRNATGEPVKTIYYTSALARELLIENEGKGIRFVHCGVKMFMKQDVQGRDTCRWRIQSEGMPIVESWVGEDRVVRLRKRATLHKLLKEMFPRVAGDAWKELGEIGERVRDIGMGCCVLRIEAGNGEDEFRERLVLPLWRGVSSLNLMLPKEERKATLLRLYNDTSELIDYSQDRQKQQQNNNKDGASVTMAKEDDNDDDENDFTAPAPMTTNTTTTTTSLATDDVRTSDNAATNTSNTSTITTTITAGATGITAVEVPVSQNESETQFI